MLDRFFDWWPLVALLSLGGIAQIVSALWPGLKGPGLVAIVLAVFAMLFGAWMLIAPPHHAFAGFAPRTHWDSHSTHGWAARPDRAG